ncbi:MAG: branched-chain amino acid transport system II carrier protein [Firmicutes bacterium]|nr:branched-chain amino acid transport system II carrier protein [Bacillota bacterium]
MNKRASAKYIAVMGLACFANYFGAGNLIFPPYLGLHAGTDWFTAFMFYIAVDAGLAVLCLIASARHPGGFAGIIQSLGRVSGSVLLAKAICLGPLIAVPRTAATTFSLSFSPLIPGISSWIVTFVFFAIVTVLCLNPSKVVDAIGSYMAPLLVAGLAVLIIKGVVSIHDPIVGSVGFAQASREGLIAGYQTMDMMGSALFYTMLIVSALSHNIDKNDWMRSFSWAGVIAALGLFVVYMGLSYLGARTSSIFSPELSQAELLVAITHMILGKTGTVLLAVIVFLACLTTAIGLTSSCAETVQHIFGWEGRYKPLVLVCIVISYLLSNIGLSNIIKFAAPVLELLYPVIIVCVALSFLPEGRFKTLASRMGAGLAFAATAYGILDNFTAADLGSSVLPLSELGLGWLLPAVAGLAAAYLITKSRRKA